MARCAPLFAAACWASVALARRDCNIDIVGAEDMTPSLFEQKYYLQKPVLISGLNGIIQQKRATKAGKGSLSSSWSADKLLRRHGDAVVKVGSSSTVVKTRGSGHLRGKLGAVLAASMHPEPRGEGERGGVDLFAFDRNSNLFKQEPELLRDVWGMAAGLFGQRAAGRQQSDLNFYLSVGGRGTGLSLHQHHNAWLLLFEGRKQWHVLDSRDVPPPLTHETDLSVTQWLDSFLPNLKPAERRRLLSCEQRAGELLYVPETWWHATRNEDQVAVALGWHATAFQRPIHSQEHLLQHQALLSDSYLNPYASDPDWWKPSSGGDSMSEEELRMVLAEQVCAFAVFSTVWDWACWICVYGFACSGGAAALF